MTTVRAAATPVDGVTRRAFRGLAALRRARAFHPVGAAYRGVAVIGEQGPTGVPPGEWPSVVRFSRGAGLPETMPDLLGIAVRLEGAAGLGEPIDLLMTSTGSGPIGRRLLRPSRSFSTGRATTLLPYAGVDGRVRFSARLRLRGIDGLAEVDAACGDPWSDGLELELGWAEGRSAWLAFGSVLVRRRLDAEEEHALDLDPFHTAPELVPAGLLNRLRRPAYLGSREGRGAS